MGTFYRIRTFSTFKILWLMAVAVGIAFTNSMAAEQWNGTYTIIPASASRLVLQTDETTVGSAVSIGTPAGTLNQVWLITPQGQDSYFIRPADAASLAMAVKQGGTENGAPVILEERDGNLWQQWSIKPNKNGTVSFFPKHVSGKGLDNFRGRKTPGAKQDLWNYRPGDPHLEWIIKPINGASLPIAVENTKESTVMLPSEVPQIALPQNAPEGEIKELFFDQSRIFPGTVRKICVFIPAQYDGQNPACVYIRTDGYRPQEKPLMEGLIAAGKMPVTIGVFVTPGHLPAPDKTSFSRRNRCLEYDGMGDSNARFFLEEVLPFVAQELNLKLSDDGNDRCIAGGSSGGITAFNAAWERPEAFSRVYACSGSFVAFRGGHEFPTLVRKTEAKPIRAYLTTGTDDMKNCAGNWFLVDQQMDKALRFSGYDYMFRTLEGRHGAGFYECYTEAMTFLWKDWPESVKAGPSAPRVQDVILPDEGWQLVAENRVDVQSGTCNAAGEVFFADVAENKVYCIGLDGQIRKFLSDSESANGITVGPQGNIYTVSKQTGRIMQYSPDGKGQVVAKGIFGDSVMAHPNGGLYVTCSGSAPEDAGTVWFIKDGQKQQVDSGLKKATGIAYRPDQWLLSVADGASKWVYSYQIDPNGTLSHKEKFFWLHVPDWADDAGAESICYAREGQMFVGTRMGIQICADDGPTQTILPMPDHGRVFGVCLGGADGDMLFAFCGDKILRRKVKVHAMGAFTPWIKINPTPL